VLARAAGAPVVVSFCVLGRDGHYRLSMEPPIQVKLGEEVDALRHAVAALEHAVRAHPTQWFNFFDVWSPPHAGD
jgi:predicted LPLAT superfamily acyltransferase